MKSPCPIMIQSNRYPIIFYFYFKLLTLKLLYFPRFFICRFPHIPYLSYFSNLVLLFTNLNFVKTSLLLIKPHSFLISRDIFSFGFYFYLFTTIGNHLIYYKFIFENRLSLRPF